MSTTQITYEVEGKLTGSGRWSILGSFDTLEKAIKDKHEFEEWNQAFPEKTAWTQFRIIEETSTRKELKPPEKE